MHDLLSGHPWLAVLAIGSLGVLGYIVSNLSGGGGSIILVPVISQLMGPRAVAPVLNLGEFIGEPVRVLLLWRYIRWDVTRYYLPSAILGALVAGLLFKSFGASWLKILIGVFLVSTIIQYRFGERKTSFPMKPLYFAPVGLFVGFFSTLVGSMGPILNPFYLNCRIEKEAMIGTKAVNSLVLDVVQISLYGALGILAGRLWVYGAAVGVGAIIGNVIGKGLLARISAATFRRLVVTLMVLSGAWMIWSELRRAIAPLG